MSLSTLESGRGVRYRRAVTVLSLSVAVGFPLAAALLLRAPERAPAAIAFAVALNLLFRSCADGFLSRRAVEPVSGVAGAQQRYGSAQLIPAAVLAVAAGHLVISILIIPFSAYLAWFRMVEIGQQRGPVSAVFVSAVSYFAAVISGRMYRDGVSGPTLTLVAVMPAIAALAFRSVSAAGAALLAATVALAVNAGGRSRRPAPAVMMTAAGLVAAVLAVSMLLAAPGAARGNRYIDNRLSPMLRRAVVRVFPRYPLLYGGDGYGYSFDEQVLGGTPFLSPVPIFEITARPGERIYLRTDAFDHYSGTSWMRTHALLDRLRDPAPEMTRTYSGEAASVPLPVAILTDFFEKVPHTLTTRAVAGTDETEISSVLGHFDVGYLFELPLGRGATFELERVLAERNTIDERNLRRNVQLPEEISDDVRRIAEDLGRGRDDPRDVLSAITAYLADGFDYSLDTGATMQEVDFVEEFLFGSRVGYCVHFATSLVVLARMNGIPARYVTGFLVSVPVDDYDDIYIMDYVPEMDGRVRHRVTGYSAHAWPEVWLPDSGWVVWEATPAMRVGEYDDLAYLQALQDPDSFTSRQLREILGRRDEADAEQSATGERSDNGWYPLLMIPGVTLAGFLLVGVRRRHVPMVDTRRAVDILALRMAQRLRRQVPSPAQVGWRAWCAAARRLRPQRHAELDSAAELIQRTLFSGYRPARCEVLRLRELERSLARARPRGPGSG